MTSTADDRQATVREVLAVREFKALWFALGLSLIGDQLARVALAVLIFDRTGSAGLTAVTYALTYLPAAVSGPLLSGLADRYDKRAVMVVADLLRAGLALLMAWPGLPVPLVGVTVVGVVLLNAPANAARLATMPLILEGDRYTLGMGITSMTQQAVQLVGFAGGGLLIAAFGPHVAFLLNAGTFVLSALVLRISIRPHAAAVSDPRAPSRSVRRTTQLIWTDGRLRYLLLLTCLYGFFVVPEGLAVPYAAEVGIDASAVGLLMGADPIASALGTFLITRFVSPVHRVRLLAPLAVLSGIPLICFALRPGLAAALFLLALTGLASAYLAVTFPTFMRLIPEDQRGQAAGLISGALVAAQGIGLLAGGLLGEWLTPASSVAVCAVAGVLAAAAASLGWLRASTDRANSPPNETQG